MRLVFAGTPDTAVPVLDALLASRHEVAAVVTRPDAPTGRGRKVEASPVARRAAAAGLEVLTPARVRDPEFLDRLRAIGPDCCPVTAYGALLPQAALDIPARGWVNLHFSILPAWRGAAPVQHAIAHGDDVTGASTFLIVRELDAGPVYGVLTEPVRADDTTGTLLGRLAHSGAELLVATLNGIEEGTLQAVPQPAEGVSFAPKINPDDARVDWKLPAHVVDRQIRAWTPDPGAWTELDGVRVKLGPVLLDPQENLPDLAPGELQVGRRAVLAGTGSRPVRLGDLQAPGKRWMTAQDWARGLRSGGPVSAGACPPAEPCGSAEMPGRPQRTRPRRPAASQPRSAQPGPARSRPRADPARRAAYDVLRAVADRDAYANLLLPALLSERGLAGRDAAFATELTYGTLRGRGTYDAILAACSDRDELDPPVREVLRLGTHQLLATRVGRHAAVSTSVDLAKDVCGPRPSGFVNAVLRRVATRDLDEWIKIAAPDPSRDPSGYLAIRYSYPRWIIDAFRDALGLPGLGPDAPPELEDALAAGNARPAVVLALAPGQAPASPADGERTRWSPYGYRLAGGDPAALVAAGAAVQDEASQLAALALTRIALTRTGPDPQAPEAPAPRAPEAPASPDRLWLDLCAGPGGKARLLAGLAADRGAHLIASDVRPHRARHVRDALSRAGGSGHGVIAADGRRVPWSPGTFDRVLADVPCSGLGSLRRRPEARWRKTPADVAELAALQRQLLSAAIDAARPGGVVAYVTCSPHLAETQDVVTDVVQARPDVTILDAPAVLPEVPALRALDPRFAQFWPHRHGTDAIFLSLLRRC